METMLVYILLIALIMPACELLSPPDVGRPQTYRGPAAVTLALGLVFFGLGSVQAPEAPGAWAFRAFYGSLCILTLAAANLFACMERSHA